MTDRELIERLWRCVVDAYGGEVVEAWAREHYTHRRSFTAIARTAGCAPSTVHKKVNRLRGALAMHGVLPASWRRRD